MTQSKPVIDPSVLEQQLGGDEAFLAEVVNDYRNQRRQISSALQNAYRAHDWSEVNALAHRLKGSLLTLGGKASAEAAFQVEGLAKTGDSKSIGDAIDALERALDELDPALARLVETGFQTR